MTADTVTLADVLEELRALRAEVAELRRASGAYDCGQQPCSYSQYLAYGPPDLTHEGFHEAERLASAHMRGCRYDWNKGHCPICIDWERRLRA